MYTSVNRRSASAYQRVGVETAMNQASPHQVVVMLFDRFLQVVGLARSAMQQGNLAAKGEYIIKAVRIIDEGLKPSLNLQQGGDLAANLNGVYGYCVLLLTQANLKNDEVALADVARIIQPIAQGWKEIGDQVAA